MIIYSEIATKNSKLLTWVRVDYKGDQTMLTMNLQYVLKITGQFLARVIDFLVFFRKM